MPVDLGRVRELETQIRDFVTRPRLQHVLLKDKLKWNVLCSSLDVVGDTDLAISAYKQLGESDDVGFRYLVVYGILQVLFVQQDAVGHICESLGIACPTVDVGLLYVRELRHDATGHPTKREARPKKGRPQSSHFIARVSLTIGGFRMMSVPDGGKADLKEVQISDLLPRQEAGIITKLEMVVQNLREREEAHRMEFKDIRLSECFDSNLGYCFQKLFEGCNGNAALSRNSWSG